MLTSVSHLFSHLVLVGLQEFVGGRERRAVRRASTAGVRGIRMRLALVQNLEKSSGF